MSLLSPDTYMNAIPIFVWTGHTNFGDQLNFDLVQYLGFDYRLVSPKECRLIAIGSILHEFLVRTNHRHRPRSNNPLFCWGSGFIGDENAIRSLIGEFSWEFNRDIHFRALRGRLSQRMVQYITGTSINVPLGDPGLLASSFFKSLPKKYDVGIILHWKEKLSFRQKRQLKLRKLKVKHISPAQSSAAVVAELSQCRCVLSSSLHGLVIADSFRIPNMHIITSDLVEGGSFKFADYYTCFRDREYSAIDLRGTTIDSVTIDRIVRSYRFSEEELSLVCQRLLAALPCAGDLVSSGDEHLQSG